MSLVKGIILGFLFAPVLSFAYTSPGTPSGLVNDYANLLSAESRTTLESELLTFEKETSTQITVVTVVDLGGDTIENFAVKLFEEWGIGQKGKDNGALLLISRDDHKLRIEVGYGLEGALTDALSSQIIRNVITPSFKNNDYNTGILEGARAMMSATRGEYTAEPDNSSDSSSYIDIRVLIFFAFVILRAILFFLAATPSWWAGGVLGGLFGIVIGLFTGFAYTGIIALVVLIPLGLLSDFLVSRSYEKYKNGSGVSPWWMGGGRSGGGSSHGGWSGGGGFSGGRSGGGGSSGGW
jgi:uncharacterized protein